MYAPLRSLLFQLDPETAHDLTVHTLAAMQRLPGTGALLRLARGGTVPPVPVRIMGMDLANPVGLAAGLDKNAECTCALAQFGFGWLEVGTVTPRPQSGNLPPRMFRLPEHGAIINRMGFNNVGLALFLNNLASCKPACPVGVNIGKNRDTPLERANDDYVDALRAVYPHADYVTVNISSPNTIGLRDLQQSEHLDSLLEALKREQTVLAEQHGQYVPIALKIAPDLDDGQIAAIAMLVRAHRFDAVIATNTTLARAGVEDHPLGNEAGGLSGRPLKTPSTIVVGKLFAHLKGEVPIIGVGGIETAEDAWGKLLAGADAVQVYSALIYRGPGLVREIVTGLAERVARAGTATLAEAVARERAKKPSS
jgi:dihydroorotate dehydrogenase